MYLQGQPYQILILGESRLGIVKAFSIFLGAMPTYMYVYTCILVTYYHYVIASGVINIDALFVYVKCELVHTCMISFS